jgi:hypothetical protein
MLVAEIRKDNTLSPEDKFKLSALVRGCKEEVSKLKIKFQKMAEKINKKR